MGRYVNCELNPNKFLVFSVTYNVAGYTTTAGGDMSAAGLNSEEQFQLDFEAWTNPASDDGYVHFDG